MSLSSFLIMNAKNRAYAFLLQPNGANLTGGGTGRALASSSASPSALYVPFNGADGSLLFSAGAQHAVIFGLVGVVLGVFGVLVRV